MKKVKIQVPIKWEEQVKEINDKEDCPSHRFEFVQYNGGTQSSLCYHDAFEDSCVDIFCQGINSKMCPLEG